MKTKAFTLIELLIVIAIIAILALIAIPNFLEAQLRGKVSRAKADMRSMATAITAYIVDYNDILGQDDMRLLMGGNSFPVSYARWMALARLTTPIAYTTTIPRDPFVLGSSRAGSNLLEEYNLDTFHSWNGAATEISRGFRWALSSFGPMRKSSVSMSKVMRFKNNTDMEAICYLYDPTNGSMSEGMLIWTNKGMMDKPDTTPGI